MFPNKQVNELHENQKFHGDVYVIGNLSTSVTTGLTAGTTQTQAGAVNSAGDIINVTVTANANDGVQLPSAKKGMRVTLINTGASNLKVWPADGEKVNTGTTDAADATVLATAKARLYVAYADGDFTRVVFE